MKSGKRFNMLGVQCISQTIAEISVIRDQLTHISPHKVNIIPLLHSGDLYMGSSMGIMRLCITNRICDLLPLNLYTLKSKLPDQPQ